MNTREGVILSFKIIIDSKGILVTELSKLPIEDAHKVFAGGDLTIVKKILREGLVKLEGLHDYLESELDAFK
tara:strand:- start:401 stop:616 length:216 start_codon:yes stop_codon:yes gene_type:complete